MGFNAYAATELAAAPNTSILWVGPILCEIVNSGGESTNKWRYRLKQCGIDPADGTYVAGPTGTFDTEEQIAWNTCEIQNTALVASGITVADLPSGFALAAIPDGEPVLAWFRFDEDVMVGIFTRPGEFDGTCP